MMNQMNASILGLVQLVLESIDCVTAVNFCKVTSQCGAGTRDPVRLIWP